MRNNKKYYIICTPLTFYASDDERAFFEWIKRMKSIDTFEGIGRELYLYFSSNDISREDLLSLMALFDRYHLQNPQQLEIFKNKSNQCLFDLSERLSNNEHPSR